MKALTICQPYPHLIMLPTIDPNHKRVENREYPFSYRGPLLIHAGKSRSWLNLSIDKTFETDYGIRLDDMTFGAILGVCNLSDCVRISTAARRIPVDALQRFPWLATHKHAGGPYCLVLTDVKKFREPIPYRGAQGLFNVPDNLPGLKEAISNTTPL